MITINSKTIMNHGALLFIIAAILLLSIFTARADESDSLKGEAFSDPSYVLDMPDEWMNQDIEYESWAENADIAITLDQHLYTALISMINAYAEENDLNISVKEGTCGISGGLLYHKAVDMAGFCCPPAKTDRFPGLRYHTVGIGALAILVHPDNAVDNITFSQAQQIYQGKITRWSDLANEDKREIDVPIKPVARLHCPKRPGHWRPLLDNEDLFGIETETVGSIEDVMIKVYQDPGAIGGAETLYMAHYRYSEKKKLKPLLINGYSSEEQSHLISGNYPLYFSYNITTWEREGSRNPYMQKFVEYILEHADQIDAKFGIVPAMVLRKAGWKFKGNELIGEPDRQENKE
jgi:hypothetical protein